MEAPAGDGPRKVKSAEPSSRNVYGSPESISQFDRTHSEGSFRRSEDSGLSSPSHITGAGRYEQRQPINLFRRHTVNTQPNLSGDAGREQDGVLLDHRSSMLTGEQQKQPKHRRSYSNPIPLKFEGKASAKEGVVVVSVSIILVVFPGCIFRPTRTRPSRQIGLRGV